LPLCPNKLGEGLAPGESPFYDLLPFETRPDPVAGVTAPLPHGTLSRKSDTLMWETCSVDLTVRLPRDIAAQAEEVQKSDPEFLSRIVLYGLTRRSVYRHLQDASHRDSGSHENHPGSSPPLV
jgi:hypothetical protein